jgi:hypothetical protein
VMNLAGEHDSLMNNHRATNARLYPRHLERILSVQECRSESPAAGGAAR